VWYYVYGACGRRPHVTISVHTYIHMHTHMCVERADVDHMSRDARFERAVAPCLAAGVHARQSSDQGCASAAASSARRRFLSSSGVGGSASSQSIQKPMAQRLMDLMQLLEDGLINQEEFDTQRAEIISSV